MRGIKILAALLSHLLTLGNETNTFTVSLPTAAFLLLFFILS